MTVQQARPETATGCACGSMLVACVTCGLARCLECDPYRSDDCLRELAAVAGAGGRP
jgi:hypothetical protein